MSKIIFDIMSAPIQQDAGPGANLGFLAAANANRFSNAHLSEALSAYVQGIPETGEQALLNAIFPVNPAPMRFEYRTLGKDQALLVESDEIRAVGADFKRIRIDGAEASAKLQNKGLTVSLDKDAIGEGDREAVVAMIIARLARNDLKRGLDMLDSLDTNEAKTWTPGDGSTAPDSDVYSMVDTGGNALGVDPNTVLFGGSAWALRMAYYEASAGNAGAANLSPEQVATKLMLDRVGVCKVRQRTVEKGTKSAMLANYVYAFYTGGSTRFDPSHVKRFALQSNGSVYTVFEKEEAAYIDITVSHHSLIAQAIAEGVRRLTIS